VWSYVDPEVGEPENISAVNSLQYAPSGRGIGEPHHQAGYQTNQSTIRAPSHQCTVGAPSQHHQSTMRDGISMPLVDTYVGADAWVGGCQWCIKAIRGCFRTVRGSLGRTPAYRGARSAQRFCVESAKIGDFHTFAYRRDQNRSRPALLGCFRVPRPPCPDP
jgi:hypothetical protein